MSAIARATSNKKERARDQGRVLLVTDKSNAPLVVSTLENAGFAVVGVTGGAAALISLRRTRPHIVVFDVDLKGITAPELINSLGPVHDGASVIIVGEAVATNERRSEAIAIGAFDYLQMPSDIPLLVARTRQLVTLKQMLDRLRAEADRDYLTGLTNRRRFRTALGQELERWRRYGVPCALVLIDIDHLKTINDQHGHPAGDRVIRHVASALTELSRDNDTAARLGGEEFALLLAGVDEQKAFAAAERLRHEVSATPVDDLGIVTVSLGMAACRTHARSERAVYAASDAALYSAKREGRNRTVVADVVGAWEDASL